MRVGGGQENVGLARMVPVFDLELGQIHRDIVDVGLGEIRERDGGRKEIAVGLVFGKKGKWALTLYNLSKTGCGKKDAREGTHHVEFNLLHPRHLRQQARAHVIKRLLDRHTIHALIRRSCKLINQGIQHQLVQCLVIRTGSNLSGGERPFTVKGGANKAIVCVAQRPKFVPVEVLESGLCRLEENQGPDAYLCC